MEGGVKERISVEGVYPDHNFSRLGHDQFWDILRGLVNGWLLFRLVSVQGDVQPAFCIKHPDYNNTASRNTLQQIFQ